MQKQRKTRSDKGGHHNYPKRNKNVAADIKISNKQQLLNLVNKNIEYLKIKEQGKLETIIANVPEGNERADLINELSKETNSKGSTYNTLLQLKAGIENKRMVTAKSLKLYMEMIASPGEHYSRDEIGGRLVLNMLAKAGVDISDTTAIRKALGGYTPKELYNAYNEQEKNTDEWYDVLDTDIEATIAELVEYLNNKNAKGDPIIEGIKNESKNI